VLRSALTAVLLVALFVFMAWLVVSSPAHIDRTTALECESLYRRARTATESSAVDRYRPRVTKGGTVELNCGTLRSLGTADAR
jgi:hypothetical protein